MSYSIDLKKDYVSFFDGSEPIVNLGLFSNSGSDDSGIEFYAEDMDGYCYDAIIKMKADEFPENFRLLIDLELLNEVTFIEISRPRGSKVITLQKSLKVSLQDWSQPFSPMSFIDRFVKEAKVEDYNATFKDYAEINAYIHVTVNSRPSESISSMLLRLEEFSVNLYNEVIEKMNYSVKNDLLIKVFNFPEEYQGVCTQYLVWFGEFLKDLGISANIHSEQNGSKTKIIIAPDNASEMLYEVESLFYRYLALPYSEIMPSNPNSFEEVTLVNSLNAQISHFKAQLQMKESIIQLKDATIGTLNSKLQSRNEELLLLSSLQDEHIEIFDGAISLGNIVWGPLKISPSKILKKLGAPDNK